MSQIKTLLQKARTLGADSYIQILAIIIMLVLNAFILAHSPFISGLPDIKNLISELIVSCLTIALISGGFLGIYILILVFESALFFCVFASITKVIAPETIASITGETGRGYLGYATIIIVLSLIPAFVLSRHIPFQKYRSLLSIISCILLTIITHEVTAYSHWKHGENFFETVHYKESYKAKALRLCVHEECYYNQIFSLEYPQIAFEWGLNLQHGDPGLLSLIVSLGLDYYDPGFGALTYKKTKQLPEAFVPTSKLNNSKLNNLKDFVLVIGESASSLHQSIYGYPLETTPNLKALEKDNVLFHIGKVHAAAPATRWAVLPYLSFWSPDKMNDWREKESLIELAHDAGYKVYHISNQNNGGSYGGAISYLEKQTDCRIHPSEQTSCPTFKHLPPITQPNRDDKLIPYVKAALQDKISKHKLIIVHLKGSHGLYNDKYDAEDKKALPSAHEYDLSIHKTDRVLSILYRTVSDQLRKPFNFLYVSDHGEDVTHGGHTLMYSKEQYLIPVITNNQEIKSEIESLRNPENSYFSSSFVPYIIAHHLGAGDFLKDKLIEQIKADDVWHIDGKIYHFLDVPEPE